MTTILRSSCVNLTRRIFHGEPCTTVSRLNRTYLNRLLIHTSAFLNVKGTDLKMPSLSPTMTTGTIVKWYKKEGDPISPGDVLCDIQTDKAVMSFETEEEGVLAKVLIPEGTAEIQVGTLIGLIVGEGEDWRSVEMPTDSQINAAETTEKNDYQEEGSSDVQNVLMPSLSPTMSEGTIVKWCKNEGDTIAPGDVLCDIQTDKAVMSFETEEEGILAKILVKEGSSGIQVGSLIALIVPEGADWKNVKIPSAGSKISDQKSINQNDDIQSKDINKKISDSRDIITYGPAVRILLELYQIDGTKIEAGGRNKRLLKSDVLNYITANKLQPKPAISVPLPTNVSPISYPERKRTSEKYTDIELSSMRKTIANRLTSSKRNIPHAYATMSCQISNLLSLRKQLKVAGINVSVNDFVIKAAALSLKHSPHVNKLYLNDEVIANSSVDISVAVATDSGLITPIVKNADEKTVDEISSEVKELAGRARLGKLQLHEFQGGSFTISNLGMFGISEFSAIINPPQCAILAVGGGLPFVDTNKKSNVKMTSTLSYDSRAISESAAADFLETLQWLLQNPMNIIVGSTSKANKVYA